MDTPHDTQSLLQEVEGFLKVMDGERMWSVYLLSRLLNSYKLLEKAHRDQNDLLNALLDEQNETSK